MDKGPWKVIHDTHDAPLVGSDDFTHDVWLRISGDFGDAEKLQYAEWLCEVLNRASASARPVQPMWPCGCKRPNFCDVCA
jgi:hypothetical protein